MSLGLILPPSATEPRQVLRCKVPGCEAKFSMDEGARFVRHVKGCSTRNADRIEAEVARVEGNYFTSPADREKYEHFRRGRT